MRFKLRPIELFKLQKLIETKERSIIISDMLMNFYMTNKGFSYVKDRNDYIEKMRQVWNVGEFSKEDKRLIDKYIKPYIEELDISIITENPYYNTVKIPEINEKDCRYETQVYNPYQGFAKDDIEVDSNFDEYPQTAYFKEKVTFPSLVNKNGIWMAINPNEIFTMKEAIAKAHGEVITYGLGLGYFAYMVHLKNEVTSITIIEKDKNVINLFNKHIRRYFNEGKCPINIIHSDAFKVKYDKTYDFAFVDIYHNPEDGLPIFIKFIANKNTLPIKELSFWLERSLYAYLRRLCIYVIQECLDDVDSSFFNYEENETDHIINKIFHIINDMNFTSFDDIKELLSIEGLNRLIMKMR